MTTGFGYTGKEASGNVPDSAKKSDKTHMLPSTYDNEEGKIVDGGGSPCNEEELYIAFSQDAPLPNHGRWGFTILLP